MKNSGRVMTTSDGGPAEVLGTENAVELRGVGKAYGDRDPKWAIRDINLTVPDGEFTTIVGQSGSGKTTLIRLVDYLLEPTAGKVTVFGRELKGVPEDVSFVFQDVNLLPWRNVLQNVELALLPLGLDRPTRRDRAMAALQMVRMDQHCSAAPYTLSGGMQQRVGVARALAARPRLLLMDEPFGQLDSFTRRELQGDFSALAEQLATTVVFVTHDIDEAILLSDRIVVMGGSPGGLWADIPVNLPPRRWESNIRANPEAIALHDRLEAILRGAQPGAQTEPRDQVL